VVGRECRLVAGGVSAPREGEHQRDRVCGRRDLELVLDAEDVVVKVLELGAEAAGCWALGGHDVLVGLALSIVGPGGAVVVLVLAHVGAHAARLRTPLVHVVRVVLALAAESPHGTLRLVDVHAWLAPLARFVAAVWAVAQNIGRVVGAFAIKGPAGAVVHLVFAAAFADFAGNWTVHMHVDWVVRALARVCPVVAVIVEIGALRSAEATTRRTNPMHVFRSRLALALLGPVRTRLFLVGTLVEAGTA